MRHTTFRQLEVFEAIVRLGSFTRAADELFLTQPTVSMQIKKLTDAVGLPLFDQVGKKIYLTDAGRELHQTCQSIFEHFERFEMVVANMKGLKAGKLRLAVVASAKYFVPQLLGMFCSKYPDVDVSLKVTNRERLLKRLANNQDDLYILSQPPKGVNAEVQTFLRNPLVVLAPIDHPMSRQKGIAPEHIVKEPFLSRELGSVTRTETEQFFAERGLKLKIRMELGSNEAIKQAIIGGLGISVLSQHALVPDMPTKQLAILDVQGFPINRQWYYAYPSGKQLSIVAQEFIGYLQQAAKCLVEKFGHYANIVDYPMQNGKDGNC